MNPKKQETNSSQTLINTLKDKLGWDSWHDWHPKSQLMVKLFPIVLILLAIPLTVNVLQQQQSLNQFASPRCDPNIPGLAKNCASLTKTPTPTQIITYSTPTPTSSVITSTPIPTQTPTPTQAPTSTTLKTVTVTSISGLKTALADNTVDIIIVKNGTYHVSGASNKFSDSLWIGSAYAGRTRPILVRAQTIGGVIFDGGGTTYFGGITFVEGAHDQTWQGFKFTNGEPTGTGVIVFGGYNGLAAPHHITLLDTEVSGLITKDGLMHGYPIYFSMAASPGPHDLLIDRFKVVDTGQSKAAFHWYHDYLSGDPAGNYNTQNVTLRNANVTGTDQAIIIWANTINNLVIEDSTITGARIAVRYEYGNGIILRRVTSTGSKQLGFYSSKGTNPPEVTFIDTSLK